MGRGADSMLYPFDDEVIRVSLDSYGRGWLGESIEPDMAEEMRLLQSEVMRGRYSPVLRLLAGHSDYLGQADRAPLLNRLGNLLIVEPLLRWGISGDGSLPPLLTSVYPATAVALGLASQPDATVVSDPDAAWHGRSSQGRSTVCGKEIDGRWRTGPIGLRTSAAYLPPGERLCRRCQQQRAIAFGQPEQPQPHDALAEAVTRAVQGRLYQLLQEQTEDILQRNPLPSELIASIQAEARLAGRRVLAESLSDQVLALSDCTQAKQAIVDGADPLPLLQHAFEDAYGSVEQAPGPDRGQLVEGLTGNAENDRQTLLPADEARKALPTLLAGCWREALSKAATLITLSKSDCPPVLSEAFALVKFS